MDSDAGVDAGSPMTWEETLSFLESIHVNEDWLFQQILEPISDQVPLVPNTPMQAVAACTKPVNTVAIPDDNADTAPAMPETVLNTVHPNGAELPEGAGVGMPRDGTAGFGPCQFFGQQISPVYNTDFAPVQYTPMQELAACPEPVNMVNMINTTGVNGVGMAGYGQCLDLGQQTLPVPAFDTGYKLEDCQNMQLRVSYQKIAIGKGGRHDLNNLGGFVMYHKLTCSGLPESVTQFELPVLKSGLSKDEKVTYLTNEVLKLMDKGVFIQYENGCIYATRYCLVRVFIWTTQQPQSIRLKRGEKTPVFCYDTFFKSMEFLERTKGNISKEKSPTIVFTFGQPWNTSSGNLNDIFVHAEVKPMKAVEKYWDLRRRLTGEQYEMVSMTKSLTADDIQQSVVSV